MDEIDRLIVKLGDPDPEVRSSAAWRLGVIKDARPFPALVEALKDEEWGVRKGAAEALGKIGEANSASSEVAEAVPALIEALKDENIGVRRDVVDALGRFKDARAIPALIETLKDKNLAVQEQVRNALTLGKLNTAIELGKVRTNAAWALAYIGAPAVPALVEALKDRDAYVREWAAGALGEIQGVHAVPELIETLNDENCKVRAQAVRALGDIAKANSGNSDVAKAVPALIEALNDENCDVRVRAVHALGEIKVVSAVPVLIEALKDEDASVRYGAAHALGDILKTCKTIDRVCEFEARLKEGLELVKKHSNRDEIAGIGLEVSQLRIEAAKKKNELAPKRDIILDGIPRPPKKGGTIYHSMRRAVRDG
jgi:HEAT repeat protein